MLDMDQYQDRAGSTAIYQGSVEVAIQERTAEEIRKLMYLQYCALKLNGEAGEIAEEIGKALRDDMGIITHERRVKLEKELGDVLWYVSRMAKELNLLLSYVATMNLRKLQSRQERDELHGSGSDR